MTWVAGADGCRGGWVVARRHLTDGAVRVDVVEDLRRVLDGPEAPAVLGVDIPIGLLDAAEPGGRACERAARARLGARSSSVFSAPVRAALHAKTYEEACRESRASSEHGLAISLQSFHILPKIRAVDAWMTPELQERVFEVHPELAFQALNDGEPLAARKKQAAGAKERRALLHAAWGPALKDAAEARPPGAQRDDVLDALAAAWSAARILAGEAVRLPEGAGDPARDARGLRMEIVF